MCGTSHLLDLIYPRIWIFHVWFFSMRIQLRARFLKCDMAIWRRLIFSSFFDYRYFLLVLPPLLGIDIFDREFYIPRILFYISEDFLHVWTCLHTDASMWEGSSIYLMTSMDPVGSIDMDGIGHWGSSEWFWVDTWSMIFIYCSCKFFILVTRSFFPFYSWACVGCDTKFSLVIECDREFPTVDSEDSDISSFWIFGCCFWDLPFESWLCQSPLPHPLGWVFEISCS